MSATHRGRYIGSPSPIAVIQPGDTISLGAVGAVTVEQVTQRNWSRVATARSGGERYFMKQFVDRVGRWHRRGFEGDADTADSLGSTIAGIEVLHPIHLDDTRLLSLSPFVEMTTIDSIGRRDGEHEANAGRVGQAIATLIQERRIPGRPEDVLVWKGLDPKNIGWSADGDLWVFDFGPLVEMSEHHAAALAVAAGLLSRWVARPGLHLIAPERSILRGACTPVATMTSLEEVQEALRQHKALRLREPQREGMAARATQLGLQTLGRIHWRSVNREAEWMFR